MARLGGWRGRPVGAWGLPLLETAVVLVSGSVSVAPRATPDEAVVLEPGERTAVLALDAPSAPEPADLGALAWSGTVFSRDMTAAEIADRLGILFGTSVTVAPGSL